MSPKDGTTTCHRYCTAYLVSNGKPVTLAMTYVRSDEKQADAVERGKSSQPRRSPQSRLGFAGIWTTQAWRS
jgi:hypothetical protein